MRAGFSEPVLDVERMTVTYEHVFGLMRDLQAIGARNVTAGRSRTLTGKGRLRRMSERYETHRRDGRLPATYEVIYAAAWATRDGLKRVHASDGPAHASGGSGAEVHIPPGRIGRRRRP